MKSCWVINDDYNTIILSEEAYDSLNIISKHSEFHEHWFSMENAINTYPDAPIFDLKK